MATYEDTIEEDVLPLTIAAEDKLGKTPIALVVPSLTISFNADTALEEAVLGALQHEQGVGDTDYTSEANESTQNDVLLLPDPVNVSDGFYVGSAHKFHWALFQIDTPGVGNYVIDWQYWNGSAFVDLDVIYDSTADFKMTGMNDLGRIHAVVPGDWEKLTIVAGPTSITAYWYFAKVVTFLSMTTRPLATQIWIGPRGGGQVMRIQIP